MSVIDGFEDTKVYLFKYTETMINFELVKQWHIAGDFDAFVEQSDSEERIAAKQRGVNIIYTIMYDKKVPLLFNDKLAFRNKATNAPVYVEIKTEPLPNRSESYPNVMQVTAEVWIPPADVLRVGLPT